MNRNEMIDLLTGVRSSKRNYYSELKSTVDQLKKKNSQLEMLNEVMSRFAINFSVEDMLEHTLEKLQTVYPVDVLGATVHMDSTFDRSYIFPERMAGLNDLPLILENSLYREVIDMGTSIMYHERDDPAFFERTDIQALGLESVLLLPLKSSGQTIGVLLLGSRSHFLCEEEDVSFFHHFADQIAVCMENARLYHEVLIGKQRWEQTYRAVSDTIAIISPDGNVLSSNETGRTDRLFEEGVRVNEFMEKAAGIADNPFLLTLRTRQPQSAELHHGHRLFDCSCYPLLRADGSMDAVIIYLKDVTEKRRLEMQVIHSGQLAAIGEMAAGVAHELNNPLTAIIGNAQLLLRKESADDQLRPFLEDIDQCGKRCRTIIRSLLVFSRQEVPVFTLCSLNTAVKEALHLTRRQIEQHSIAIELDLAADLPAVSGNLQQLVQVAVNLLMNAKDALITAPTNEKRLIIRTAVQNGFAVFSVADNGTGIAEDMLDEIFHPFFTTKAALDGTGLGLSVSFGIAQAHGGKLSADSIEGRGTTFSLTLPIHEERQ